MLKGWKLTGTGWRTVALANRPLQPGVREQRREFKYILEELKQGLNGSI